MPTDKIMYSMVTSTKSKEIPMTYRAITMTFREMKTISEVTSTTSKVEPTLYEGVVTLSEEEIIL